MRLSLKIKHFELPSGAKDSCMYSPAVGDQILTCSFNKTYLRKHFANEQVSMTGIFVDRKCTLTSSKRFLLTLKALNRKTLCTTDCSKTSSEDQENHFHSSHTAITQDEALMFSRCHVSY